VGETANLAGKSAVQRAALFLGPGIGMSLRGCVCLARRASLQNDKSGWLMNIARKISLITLVGACFLGGAVMAKIAYAQDGTVPKVPNGPIHWQLQGKLEIGRDIRVVGADLYETPKRDVTAWRDAGLFPICYINVGAAEAWRDDFKDFPSRVIGNAYWGWPDEYWLDITQFEQFSDVMIARLDLCRDKGFLAVEPDNIDAFEADLTNKPTGFDITRSDQLRYVNWLISQAHARGLAIGQKNAADLVPDLADQMDFALLESADRLGFMAEFDPYVAHLKPVFAVEYLEEGATAKTLCPNAKNHGFQGVIAQIDLDRAPQNCP
jgi:hypothetical protein